MTAEDEQKAAATTPTGNSTQSAEAQWAMSHYQGDPEGNAVIERMFPLERKELFSLTGIIMDEAIKGALEDRAWSIDDVGLVTLCDEEHPGLEGREYPGMHYDPVYDDDLTNQGFEGINDGFSATLQMHAEMVLDAAKERKAAPEAQRAYDRLNMIAARTGIRIGPLVVDDSLSPLVGSMEGFTKKLLDEFSNTQDKDFKAKALDRFAQLQEAAKRPYTPLPSEIQLRQLWDWYAELVGKYCYYNPSDPSEMPLEAY